MTKRILITAGGTGGHVYPAVALAKRLKSIHPDLYIFFAGGDLSKNKCFDRQAFPFKDIATGYFPLKNPFKWFSSIANIFKGVLQCLHLIKKIKPNLIVGFGSYHTLPLLFAARLKKIPYILHEANSVPGKVNRLMSKKAVATGIVFPEAGFKLKGEVIEVDLPLRASLLDSGLTRQKAITHYGLDYDKKTILFFGGSQGALSINRFAPEAMNSLKHLKDNIQVIHFTGKKGEVEKLLSQYEEAGLKAYVKEYEENMEYAWVAADILVSRSGAGTIAEEIAYEKPGILIPYPYAADNHQDKNAVFMSEIVKGAIYISEKDLSGEKLGRELEKLLKNNLEGLNKLQSNIIKFKETAARKNFCDFITSSLIYNKND